MAASRPRGERPRLSWSGGTERPNVTLSAPSCNGECYAGLVRSASKRMTYLIGLACVVLAARVVYAQCSTGTREATTAVHNAPYDATFTFCRLAYESGPGGYYYYGLPAWAHGYPSSERSLMKILEGI